MTQIKTTDGKDNENDLSKPSEPDVGTLYSISLAPDENQREIASSTTQFNHFRYVIIVFAGIMMGSMLFLRFNFTVAMVNMVNRTAVYLNEHPNATIDGQFPLDYVETGEFVWNNEIQQIIATGYMVAYTVPQTFTTKLAMQYGVKPSIALSLTLCSVSTLLIPTMSYWGWKWVLILRLLNALGSSPILPTMVNVIEEFMPYEDVAIGISIFQFTENLVYISTPVLSGLLTAIHWNWTFYIPGLVGLLISLIWYIIASDTAQESKFVGQKELDLINGYSSDPTKRTDESTKKTEKRTDLPWYFMFKIKSFYPLTIIWTLCCATIVGFFFLLPKYVSTVLNIPVENGGFLNFSVQIGVLFSMLWSAPFSTYLMRKFDISLTAARRIIAFICSSFVIISYIYLALNRNNLIFAITINRFFHKSIDTVVMATVMSQFAKARISALVYSMMNAIGNFSTVIFCWAVGKYLDYTGETMECWSWILSSLAALMSLHLIIYITCCHSRPVSIEPDKTSESCGNDLKVRRID